MMRLGTRWSLIVPVLIFGYLPVLAASALTVAPDSTLWLVGESTLHPFTSKTTQLQAMTEIDSSVSDLIPAIFEKQALKHIDFTLPVKSLKSKEAALDKNMYKALKADACPTIEFHMSSYEVRTSTVAEKPVRASGTLRVACQEKTVTLDASLIPESGALRIQGQYDLMMTDYGIKPPTMMMGTIKVKDKVVIHYNIRLTVTP